MEGSVLDAEGFAQATTAFVDELTAVHASMGPDEEPKADARLERLAAAIKQVSEACRRRQRAIGDDMDQLKAEQAAFQAAIAPLFDQSTFMLRARTKPRGYPGDFETLLGIYGGKPVTKGFGGLLDLYFLGTELGRAVPGRMRYLKAWLEEELASRAGDVAVLDVACGPCEEFAHEFEAPSDKKVKITCLDYDYGALGYVEEQVVPKHAGSSLEFNMIRYNALRMRSAKRFTAEHGNYDLIYSVGLCDYLTDEQLVPMLKCWRETLKPGGTVLVAFKDTRRYGETEYQWCVDWHFYQRTEEECRKLMLDAGYDADAMVMTRDETGVIINFIASVPADEAIRRTDAAEQAAPATPHIAATKDASAPDPTEAL